MNKSHTVTLFDKFLDIPFCVATLVTKTKMQLGNEFCIFSILLLDCILVFRNMATKSCFRIKKNYENIVDINIQK